MALVLVSPPKGSRQPQTYRFYNFHGKFGEPFVFSCPVQDDLTLFASFHTLERKLLECKNR